MMVKKLKCNEDLVKDLMRFSPFGALGQVFIVEAIRKYAEALVESPLADNAKSLISPAAWNGIAADVKARCDAFYGSPGKPVKLAENEDGDMAPAYG